MHSIDIVSLDYELAREVSHRVYIKLKEKKMDAIFLDPFSTLFSKILRIVKSYAVELSIDRQTQVLIEAAREEHIQESQLTGLIKTEKIVINPHSFIAFILTQLFVGAGLKRILSKSLIKKIGLIPSYMFFLKLDLENLRIHRRKLSLEKKILTDSMKGVGLKTRQSGYIKSCSKMNSLYGTDASIIEIENKEDIEAIADAIVQKIESTNKWIESRPNNGYNKINGQIHKS